MDFGTLAPIAIQITTILGLLGFIVLGIIYVAQPPKSSFSPEVITALKNSGIKSSDLIKMPPENAKSYIASHTKISEKILSAGIHERKSQTRVVFFISIILWILALVIFILWKIFPSDYVYSGILYDKKNNSAIQGAKISIDKRPDIESSFSDLKGYFKIKIKQAEFTVIIEHPNYNKLILSKVSTDSNLIDSIVLSKERIDAKITNQNKEFSKQFKLINEKKDLQQKVEISIQLNNSTDGYAIVKANGIEADILPNSTSHNPRILLISNPNLVQIVTIITKEGDTCTLKGVFDKNKEKDFPNRFTPDCNPQKKL